MPYSPVQEWRRSLPPSHTFVHEFVDCVERRQYSSERHETSLKARPLWVPGRLSTTFRPQILSLDVDYLPGAKYFKRHIVVAATSLYTIHMLYKKKGRAIVAFPHNLGDGNYTEQCEWGAIRPGLSFLRAGMMGLPLRRVRRSRVRRDFAGIAARCSQFGVSDRSGKARIIQGREDKSPDGGAPISGMSEKNPLRDVEWRSTQTYLI